MTARLCRSLRASLAGLIAAITLVCVTPAAPAAAELDPPIAAYRVADRYAAGIANQYAALYTNLKTDVIAGARNSAGTWEIKLTLSWTGALNDDYFEVTGWLTVDSRGRWGFRKTSSNGAVIGNEFLGALAEELARDMDKPASRAPARPLATNETPSQRDNRLTNLSTTANGAAYSREFPQGVYAKGEDQVRLMVNKDVYTAGDPLKVNVGFQKTQIENAKSDLHLKTRGYRRITMERDEKGNAFAYNFKLHFTQDKSWGGTQVRRASNGRLAIRSNDETTWRSISPGNSFYYTWSTPSGKYTWYLYIRNGTSSQTPWNHVLEYRFWDVKRDN